ncbi:MAG: RidA family protein [bacterium]|nr:RidA family protein [bacterium]
MHKMINTEGAPEAFGPYSHAVLAGDFLYTAGQIPVDPATGELAGEDFRTQMHQVMSNLGNVLAEAHADFSQVIKATVYLKDLGDFAAMNTIYAEYMGENRPARACVEVARLPKNCRVEIDLIAHIDHSHY